MKACFSLLFWKGGETGLSVPLFNLLLALFPFFFISLWLWHQDWVNKEHQPTLPNRSRARTIAGKRSVRSRDGSLPSLNRLKNTATVTWKLLPQYFTIMRLVTFFDFCLAIFLLISARPEAIWYKVSSILLRACYRFVQILISLVFLLPLYQSSPANVYFEWKPACRIAVLVAAVPLIVQIAYLGSCKDYVPEADITLCNPPSVADLPDGMTAEEWVFDTTRGCNSIWLWFAVDMYEVCFFVAMFSIQMLLSHERRIFTCLAQIYRPNASLYAIYVISIRIFRLFGIFFNVYYRPHGGPYLCFFAGSYFIEHAIFPICAYFSLLGDTRWLRGSTSRGGVVEQIIKWGHGNEIGKEICVNDIELLEQIAQGWCPVRRALWLGSPVCVKIARLGMDFSFEEIKDLINELKLLSLLNHSCIVRYLGYSLKDSFGDGPLLHRQLLEQSDSIDDDMEIYIITELMDTRNLQDLIVEKDELFSLEQIVGMALDVCSGMLHLDANNVIHCDLKSPNILVLKDYMGQFRLKVADFGMSFVRDHREKYTTSEYNRSSALWTAPEVWTSKKYSMASDVYGFAIILWELLTRQVPFEGMPGMEIQEAVLGGERMPISDTVPIAFRELIRKSWAQTPEERPSFKEIVSCLKRIQAGFPYDEQANHRYLTYQREMGFGHQQAGMLEDDVSSTSSGWVFSGERESQKLNKITQNARAGLTQELLLNPTESV